MDVSTIQRLKYYYPVGNFNFYFFKNQFIIVTNLRLIKILDRNNFIIRTFTVNYKRIISDERNKDNFAIIDILNNVFENLFRYTFLISKIAHL